jgi:hypothetical protein
LKKTCLDPNRPGDRDPFLYWLIPIEYVRKHAEGREGMIPWENLGKGDDQ